MSRASKQKGKLGEREVAALLKDYGYEARRGYQYLGGSHDEPDVKHNIPGIHIEVKRTERLNLGAAYRQAEGDAGTKTPVVFHRASRQPWLVTINAQDFLKLIRTRDIYAEKQANPVRVVAGEIGCPLENGARDIEGGERGSGDSATGVDAPVAASTDAS
ncbi:MAG TPA: hypothetical protein VIY48_16270 [Candidatus Paceibacterota bacterium]